MQDEDSDKSLLRAHISGDPNALAELLKKYEGWHRGIARKRFGANDELVADAVQEAWLGIYRKADTFRGESKVSTWMYKIVDKADPVDAYYAYADDGSISIYLTTSGCRLIKTISVN